MSIPFLGEVITLEDHEGPPIDEYIVAHNEFGGTKEFVPMSNVLVPPLF